ncbi:hypothetical protein [Massilia sp. BJB1822]|uniref:hypothetical protein n=1 Tax=Massilia sp. BJB1822 TaxID=2744470 RepID=UPI001593BFC8|nr:hypothetical protein [Massilia sp. BJB1822]NVE01711.1 hypothetical protein [Massilia sp. BJB1822]
MVARIIWGGLLVVGTLTACGGGDGGKAASNTDKPAPVVPPVQPVSYSIAAPTVDDYTNYEVHITTSKSGIAPAPAAVSYRSEMLGYAPIGGSSWIEYNVASDKMQQDQFSAQMTVDRGVLAHYYGNILVSCFFSYKTPLRMIPSTVTIGQKWTLSFEGTGDTCSRIKDISPVSFTGQALAAETLAVKAGVFNTVKVGIEQSPIKQGNYSKVISYTVWRDALSGRDVKQVRTTTATNLLNGQVEVESYEEELIGLLIASTRQKKFALESLTGKWRGEFRGEKLGYCHFEISTQGDMQGKCDLSGADKALALKGKLDARGAASLDIGGGADVLHLSGIFDNPMSGEGRWSVGGKSGAENNKWVFVRE